VARGAGRTKAGGEGRTKNVEGKAESSQNLDRGQGRGRGRAERFVEGGAAGPRLGPGSLPVFRVLVTLRHPAWLPGKTSHLSRSPRLSGGPFPVTAPYPPRRITVVPLTPDQRCYGDTPGGLAGFNRPLCHARAVSVSFMQPCRRKSGTFPFDILSPVWQHWGVIHEDSMAFIPSILD